MSVNFRDPITLDNEIGIVDLALYMQFIHVLADMIDID